MYRFSKKSMLRLDSCHPYLKLIFMSVIKSFDCTVICGHRGEKEQMNAYNNGKSKLKFPDSKHNSYLSLAVDVAPYKTNESKIDWSDRDTFIYFGGYVMGIARKIGIHITWGGDWNSNNNISDNSFDDLVHFELSKDYGNDKISIR